MKILIIDNYDSFVYNLKYIIKEKYYDVTVIRNDAVDVDYCSAFDKILISPGPGLPKTAGICMKVIEEFGAIKSILGVCLGHQAIAETYGGKLINLEHVLHGVTSSLNIINESTSIFHKIPQNTEVCHYHSWVVDDSFIPPQLEVTAINDSGIIMAIKHKSFDIQGLQFHPESFLTNNGRQMIYNWLKN